MSNPIVLLDDSTRPIGPTFENLTIAQRAPGRHLQMIHNHHRQNMEMLHEMIDQVEKGEAEVQDLKDAAQSMPMLENYRRFGAVCGQHCQMVHGHHSIEDAHMFPELRAKSEAFEKVVDRLKAEHEIVHALLLQLVDSINALMQDPSAPSFAKARDDNTMLEKVLLSHFGYEENSIGDALGVFEMRI